MSPSPNGPMVAIAGPVTPVESDEFWDCDEAFEKVENEASRPVVDDEYVWVLSREVQKMAKTELGEDDSTRERCLAEMRSYVSNHPQMQTCQIETSLLLRVLRSQKFRVDKSKKLLEKYLNNRMENPQWFQNLDPMDENIQDLVDRGYVFVLPERDSAGRRVIFNYASSLDPNVHTNSDVLRLFMSTFETLMEEEEENQIKGFTYIFYCKNLTLSHCSIFTPTEAARMFGCCEKNLPLRHLDINLVGLPLGMWMVLEFAKQFLSDKIKKRINIFSDEKKLGRKLDAKILPKEFGGVMPMEEMTTLWKKKLFKNRSNLLAMDQKLKVDVTVDPVVLDENPADEKGSNKIWSLLTGGGWR